MIRGKNKIILANQVNSKKVKDYFRSMHIEALLF